MAKPVKYSYSYLVKVAWGEMDAFGHVNSVSYVRYFESARADYFTAMEIWDSPLKPASQGPLLTHLDLEYRRQVVVPDEVNVTLEVKGLSSRGFLIHTSMWNNENDCVINGEGRIIWFDFQAGKPVTIPDRIRNKFPNLHDR